MTTFVHDVAEADKERVAVWLRAHKDVPLCSPEACGDVKLWVYQGALGERGREVGRRSPAKR